MCNSRKEPATKTRSELQIYNVGFLFKTLTLKPLPVTQNRNKYLLGAIDYFTKWSEIMSLPNQEVNTVAEALVDQVVPWFGVPMELHSD